MSQLVACQFPGGLILAADRRVAMEAEGSGTKVHALRKLFALGPAAAVATSGAAVGVAVSRTLSRLLRRRAALPFEDLEAYALSVFQKTYDEFVDQGAEWFRVHPEAHRLSYVLLGGCDGPGRFAFRFYASEAHGERYRLLPTASVLAAPRRLGLEARLGRAAAAGATSEEIAGIVQEGLRLIAGKEDSVAGPFDLALLSDAGLSVRTSDGSPSA